MREKLERLSLEDLRELVTRCGIVFTEGNNQINDRDEFILVLDEADRGRLEGEYERLIERKGQAV